MSEIPANLIDFCKELAELAKKYDLDSCHGTITPGYNQQYGRIDGIQRWDAKVEWSWKQGRHGEDSNEIRINSTAYLNVVVDTNTRSARHRITLEEIFTSLETAGLGRKFGLGPRDFVSDLVAVGRSGSDHYMIWVRTDLTLIPNLQQLFKHAANVSVEPTVLCEIRAG